MSDRVYNPCSFLALLRPFSALPDVFRVPVHVPILVAVSISATALVTVRAPVPVPILCSSTDLHPSPRPRSRPVPVPIPVSTLRLFVFLLPRSRFRSRSVSTTVHAPVLAPDPVPVSVSAPDSDPASYSVHIFPSLRSGYPLGTMRVYRPRFVCMSMCFYVYLVDHNRAIQLCHPSHCIPLILSSQERINATYYDNIRPHVTKRRRTLYTYSSYLSPECLMLPSLHPR